MERDEKAKGVWKTAEPCEVHDVLTLSERLSFATGPPDVSERGLGMIRPPYPQDYDVMRSLLNRPIEGKEAESKAANQCLKDNQRYSRPLKTKS